MTNNKLIKRGIADSIIAINNDKIAYHIGTKKSYQWSDPEEKIRAATILSLIFEYDYPLNRIMTEVPIPSRKKDQYADIVVFRDDSHKEPYITIEVASPRLSTQQWNEKTDQLFGYANALKSTLAFCYNGSEKKCWKVKGYGGLERVENIIEDIPKNYGDIEEFTYKRNGNKDLEILPLNELSKKFGQCHNILWVGGKFDPIKAFDEMSKLLFAKLFDELHTKNDEYYRFQYGHGEKDKTVANRIIGLYNKARESDEGLFTAKIESSPDKITKVVRELQNVSLSDIDPDAKGRAYEQFLGEVFRGKLGQYFTRRELVNCVIDLVRPTHNDLILDPACGSGGFLIYAMQHVYSQVAQAFKGKNSIIERQKNKFANSSLYGIEISDKIARISMMGMVIYGDGHTNIENNSAFNASFQNGNIKDGKFTLVLTNPPFGDTVKNDDGDKLGNSSFSDYKICKDKRSIASELLYLERCTRFLKDGGRLGIVLPDGVLSNPSFKFIRQYLLDNYTIRAIISLPVFAFRKSGAGMKTSLLFAEKCNVKQTDKIFMGMAEHIGYDSTGRPDDDDLPDLCKHYHKNTGSLDDRIIYVDIDDIYKESNLRLDPYHYLLKTRIDNEFKSISHPVVTLDDLAMEYSSGKSPKGGVTYSDGDIPILVIGNLSDDGTLNLEDVKMVDNEFYEKYSVNNIEPLDILIAKDGATTGKVSIVDEKFDLEKCLFSEHIFRYKINPIFPDEDAADQILNSYYVFFFLYSKLGQDQIRLQITGGGADRNH